MTINKDSNSFTITFAVVMVLVVGAVLALLSLSLKPRQVQNQIQKEMISILGSVGVESTRANAENDFHEYIKERLLLNSKGEVVERREGAIDASDPLEPFNIDVMKEFRDSKLKLEDKHFPLYIANVNGEEAMVIPMAGKGLWGPVWGYVALAGDYNTVFGATFDHDGETPGLGAEIRGREFQAEFKGKKIYKDGKLISVTVAKGQADPNDIHAVDGITGGTITSKGVEEMIRRTLNVYANYFENQKTQTTQL